MLRENPGGVRAAEQRFEKYRDGRLKTPSGKVEFFSEQLQASGFAPVPFADGFRAAPISFSDQPERYPLLGISGARSSRFTHSQFHQIPSLSQDRQGCVVDIHPADAATYGIVEADRVRVETPRGWIVMAAHLSEVVHQGSLRIAWGWGDLDPELRPQSPDR